MTDPLEIAGVSVSRPDKVLFPADGITKGDVARYYAAVAGVMLPHLAGRPVNMQRFPDGIDGEGFYEKRVPRHFPDWVGRVRVATADAAQDQVVVDDERTLLYLAGQACVTPHTWLSRNPDLRRPDLLVFDLDPSVDDLAGVRRAARVVAARLEDIGLVPFLKTTGSRGYHVVAPLLPEEDFDGVRDLARTVAHQLVEEHPDLLTVEQRTSQRGDRIYVDVMRNGYGQTAVPPYAVRARAGAPVATPLEWGELSRVAPDQHTVASLPRRLGQRGDPWHEMHRHAGSAAKARERL